MCNENRLRGFHWIRLGAVECRTYGARSHPLNTQPFPGLCENLLDKTMGAPGLAFETWDPPRKGRKTKLENSNFEKAPGTDATRSNSHAHSKAQMEFA